MSALTVDACARYLHLRGWARDALSDETFHVYHHDDVHDDDGAPLLLHLPAAADLEAEHFIARLVHLLAAIDDRSEDAVREAILRATPGARRATGNPRAAREFPRLGFVR